MYIHTWYNNAGRRGAEYGATVEWERRRTEGATREAERERGVIFPRVLCSYCLFYTVESGNYWNAACAPAFSLRAPVGCADAQHEQYSHTVLPGILLGLPSDKVQHEPQR